jgi:hypothetical protein
MVVLENAKEEHIQGGSAQRSRQQVAMQAPTIKSITIPRRVKLVSNLALVALLGVILLTLSLWLGGLRLPFLPTVPNRPSLSINSGPYRVGGTLTLQGTHFSPYSIIAVLLDGQPVVDSNGLRLAVDSDGQGSFTTTLTITPAWRPGDHILGAKDTTTGQEAQIDLSIEKATGQRGG